LRLLLAVLPAAACAAAMFLCFRMMRHSDMPAEGHTESDDLATLRKEVADLRQELAAARSIPSDAAAVERRIVRRGASVSASDSPSLSPPTPAGAASPTGHPDG
jgi:hypothetical protein